MWAQLYMDFFFSSGKYFGNPWLIEFFIEEEKQMWRKHVYRGTTYTDESEGVTCSVMSDSL